MTPSFRPVGGPPKALPPNAASPTNVIYTDEPSSGGPFAKPQQHPRQPHADRDAGVTDDDIVPDWMAGDGSAIASHLIVELDDEDEEEGDYVDDKMLLVEYSPQTPTNNANSAAMRHLTRQHSTGSPAAAGGSGGGAGRACPKCNNVYKNFNHMKRHMQYECGKGATLTCSQCLSKFKRPDSLRRHMQNSCQLKDLPTQPLPAAAVQHFKLQFEY